MKSTLLFSVLCVVTIFNNCDAACQFALPVDGQLGCVYKGQVLDFGTAKEIDCYRCTCGNRGMLQCCSVAGYIANHPPECKVVKNGCFQKAVLISNPAVECTKNVVMIGR